MISAAAAANHRFGRVKRNGYDPAEVDAAVSRLIDALETYEAKVERLEARLTDADASSDAIRRTLAVAETTRDDMLAEAQAESDRILESARTEVAELREVADNLDQEIATRRERALAETEEHVASVREAAETEAEKRLHDATIESDAILERSTKQAEALSAEAAAARRAAGVAAAWIARQAREQADERLAEASARADDLIRAAEAEQEELSARAQGLRKAVASLRAAAADLAMVTAQEGSVVDLNAIEVAPPADEDDAIDEDAPEHAVAEEHELSEREVEVDDGPLLTVDEARKQMAEEDEQHDAAESETDRGPSTFYQRSTGTPLSERIKIARTSG